jgi:uncharacterized membrane protein YcgQ (UPF0703/DUF1980 family)
MIDREQYLRERGSLKISKLDLLPTERAWTNFSSSRDRSEDNPENYVHKINKELSAYNARYINRNVPILGNPFYCVRFRTEEDLVFFKLKFND